MNWWKATTVSHVDISSLGIELDDSPERVQLDALWLFLSKEVTWGRWRTREIVELQVASAWRVVGAYQLGTQDMVGFARAISDGLCVAYLDDVYVVARLRRRGIGLAIVDFMINNGAGANFRWMLHTDDAHAFYARAGFKPPDQKYLERPSPLMR